MKAAEIALEMLNRSTVFFIAAAIAVCAVPQTSSAQQYYAQPMADGTYKVIDPVTQRTSYVRDPYAWAAQKQFERTGFGSGISPQEFAKGKSVVKDTVKITARTVDGVANTTVNTALDAARFVPGVGRYSNSARQLLHGGSRQAGR